MCETRVEVLKGKIMIGIRIFSFWKGKGESDLSVHGMSQIAQFTTHKHARKEILSSRPKSQQLRRRCLRLVNHHLDDMPATACHLRRRRRRRWSGYRSVHKRRRRRRKRHGLRVQLAQGRDVEPVAVRRKDGAHGGVARFLLCLVVGYW